MSDAAPPPWFRWLSKRAHGVDAGLKVLLITAWGFGPYNRDGELEADGIRAPSAPVEIHPSAETLAFESGQPLGTVKDQLRRAGNAGWIRREKGSKMTLAWREPGCFDYGSRTVGRPGRPAGRPSRTADRPDGGPTSPDGGPTRPDGGPTLDRTVGRPQTFQGTSIGTSKNIPDRARGVQENDHDRNHTPDATPVHRDDPRLRAMPQPVGPAERHVPHAHDQPPVHGPIHGADRGLADHVQRKLARVTTPSDGRRPHPEPDALNRDTIDAIRRAGGAWGSKWEMVEPWRRSLAKAIADESLTPEQVEAVLREWNAQEREAKANGSLRQRFAARGADHLPQPAAIWHASIASREWRNAVLAELEEQRPSPQGQVGMGPPPGWQPTLDELCPSDLTLLPGVRGLIAGGKGS